MKLFLRQILVVAAAILALWTASTQSIAQDGTTPEEGKLAIDMAPFNFALLDRGRQRGKVVINLTLVVQEQRDSEMIRLRLPQIRADFLGALTSLSKHNFKVNRSIDPDLVTGYLTPFLENRIGQDKAKVYVQYAMISPT